MRHYSKDAYEWEMPTLPQGPPGPRPGQRQPEPSPASPSPALPQGPMAPSPAVACPIISAAARCAAARILLAQRIAEQRRVGKDRRAKRRPHLLSRRERKAAIAAAEAASAAARVRAQQHLHGEFERAVPWGYAEVALRLASSYKACVVPAYLASGEHEAGHEAGACATR